jgi:hypothetical protein
VIPNEGRRYRVFDIAPPLPRSIMSPCGARAASGEWVEGESVDDHGVWYHAECWERRHVVPGPELANEVGSGE